MKIYIYALCDPRDGEIRYIGKTNDPELRYQAHIYNSETEKNLYKSRWINKLKSINLKPKMEILEICTHENWKERERFWIEEYRKRGAKLTNITDGGDDTSIVYRNLAARYFAKQKRVKLYRCFICKGLTAAKNEICGHCLKELSNNYKDDWYLFYKSDSGRVNHNYSRRDWKFEILYPDIDALDKIARKYKLSYLDINK